MNTHRSSRGFTMIELLVVFAVIMALALATFPMMGEAIESSKLRGLVQGTVSQMRLARIQAIKTNGCGLVQVDATKREVASYLDQDCDPTTTNRLLGTLAFPAGIDAKKAGEVMFLGSGSVHKENNDPFSFVNRRGTTKEITAVRATGKISVE